jgi:type II secretory pathway component PulJ
VELIVALFISAIMFAFGYRALTQAISSRREVEEQSTRLLALQQAMRIIEQDFELLQPRPVRNLIGDGYQPAIHAVAPTGTGSLSTQLSGTTLSGATAAAGDLHSRRLDQSGRHSAQRTAARQLFDRERRADAFLLSGARRHRGSRYR